MAKDDFKERLRFSKESDKTTAQSVKKLLLGSNYNSAYQVTMVSLDLIDPLYSFHHSFEKTANKDIPELAEKIKVSGVLDPIIIRPHQNGRYETLAGHRRCKAARVAGLTEIPAFIRKVDDVDAKLIVTDTNLGQREEILPSEKADAYKLQVEALKQQGKRRAFTDALMQSENFRQNLPKVKELSARGIVAALNDVSVKQIACYLRLNYLSDKLLDMVDEKKIPLYAGEEISYLSLQQQQWIEEILVENKHLRITLEIAEKLKEHREELVSKAIVDAVMIPPKPDGKSKAAKPTYKTALKGVEKHIKKMPEKQALKLSALDEITIKEIIISALERYIDNMEDTK